MNKKKTAIRNRIGALAVTHERQHLCAYDANDARALGGRPLRNFLMLPLVRAVTAKTRLKARATSSRAQGETLPGYA
jgi:hypothetical protein